MGYSPPNYLTLTMRKTLKRINELKRIQIIINMNEQIIQFLICIRNSAIGMEKERMGRGRESPTNKKENVGNEKCNK